MTTLRLNTEAELADQFDVTVDKLRDLRKRYSWPHVRLSRFDVRFTDAQIEQIVASRSVQPDKPAAGNSGLTECSAMRMS